MRTIETAKNTSLLPQELVKENESYLKGLLEKIHVYM